MKNNIHSFTDKKSLSVKTHVCMYVVFHSNFAAYIVYQHYIKAVWVSRICLDWLLGQLILLHALLWQIFLREVHNRGIGPLLWPPCNFFGCYPHFDGHMYTEYMFSRTTRPKYWAIEMEKKKLLYLQIALASGSTVQITAAAYSRWRARKAMNTRRKKKMFAEPRR